MMSMVMLSTVMPSPVGMLSDTVMLGIHCVIMLSTVMLNVMAPIREL